MEYIKISPEEIRENPFKAIGDDWMLVSAGQEGDFNTMTASWGGLGVLWKEPVAFVFIRPQRYTYEYTEKCERLTLSFFGGEKRDSLALCGRVSGRDCNKVEEAGLKPVWLEEGFVTYEGATLVLCCEKLYAQDIDEEAVTAPFVMDNYKNRDFHRMYICKIVGAWRREG